MFNIRSVYSFARLRSCTRAWTQLCAQLPDLDPLGKPRLLAGVFSLRRRNPKKKDTGRMLNITTPIGKPRRPQTAADFMPAAAGTLSSANTRRIAGTKSFPVADFSMIFAD